jgi:RNA polymerase sigma factor (sigma-70 family)
VKGRRTETSWPDERLVSACLRGSEDAWGALVDKYKNLIFSIPIRQGIPRDDAGDIFQRVCLLLLAELQHLREPAALPMWLIRVTSNECLRWARQERRQPAALPDVAAIVPHRAPLPDEQIAQLKREQMLREAVASLAPRCRQLIQMLFFETPARPYQEVARSLGVALGSIAYLRGRCLTRLRRHLEKMGWR